MSGYSAADAEGEAAAARSYAVVTCVVQGNLSAAQQLIAEDPNPAALAMALAGSLAGVVSVLAAARGMSSEQYWQQFALNAAVFREVWKHRGPSL